MRKVLLIVAATLCLGLTGCASHLMKPADMAGISKPLADNESAIVFFRATNFGGAIQAPVLEVRNDGTLQFIAIVSSGAKFLHKTEPGKHLYLIDGEFGYFMEATLEGGKTYYTYVMPKMGWWRARFIFGPVANVQDETVQKDLAWCKWYENTPEGQQWFSEQKDRLEQRYANLIQRYSTFKPEDKVTMPPTYGTPEPAR